MCVHLLCCIIFLFIGCVVQYNPAAGESPENPRNPCGPKNPMCDRYWTHKHTQTN